MGTRRCGGHCAHTRPTLHFAAAWLLSLITIITSFSFLCRGSLLLINTSAPEEHTEQATEHVKPIRVKTGRSGCEASLSRRRCCRVRGQALQPMVRINRRHYHRMTASPGTECVSCPHLWHPKKARQA